jgi:hypothetical protein
LKCSLQNLIFHHAEQLALRGQTQIQKSPAWVCGLQPWQTQETIHPPEESWHFSGGNKMMFSSRQTDNQQTEITKKKWLQTFVGQPPLLKMPQLL